MIYLRLGNCVSMVIHGGTSGETHTLHDNHRTAASEVVQAIKSVKETIEDCI